MYLSDGCAAQYKNCKNFNNLCHHIDDFGVLAEWHFFATSHGRTAGDGAAGTLKQLATKSSLQRPYTEQIITPRQLHDFACSTIKGMNFAFATIEEHRNEELLLRDRFSASRTVPGTQKPHYFRPILNTVVEVKRFSDSTHSCLERVTCAQAMVPPQFTVFMWLCSMICMDGLDAQWQWMQRLALLQLGSFILVYHHNHSHFLNPLIC